MDDGTPRVVALNWCLGFPYAPNQQIRAKAWKIVSAFYRHHFPTVPMIVHSATEVGEPFLRAATRNDIVCRAAEFDIVVLIDADTLIHPDGIHRMLDLTARNNLFLGKPFRGGLNLQLPALAAVAKGQTWPNPKFNDPGAAWVIKPSTWWAVGGMDENFRSWGGEDEAFQYMLTAFNGTTEYDHLPAVKTHHATPRWFADPQWGDTWERSVVYRHISQHPELATEWLQVRSQPGIAATWVARYNISVSRKL